MNTIKISLFLLVLMSLYACGGSSLEKSKDPAKVRAAIKAKQDEIKKLEAEKADLEKWLAQIDSSAKVEKTVEITTKKLSTKDFAHFVEVQGNITTAQDPGMASSETGGRVIQLLLKNLKSLKHKE